MKNTMKTILSLAVLATATAALADYQYFYWQVDLTDEKNNPYDVEAFSYATVRESGSSSYLDFYNTSGEAIGNGMEVKEDTEVENTEAGPLYTRVGSEDEAINPGSTYLFELWQENSKGTAATKVGWATYTYSQLLATGSMYKTRSTSGGDSPFTIGVVPEPASGLLVLLGAGLAAWRRRKTRRALVAALVLFSSFGAFAAGDNLIYSFTPNANDAYADGTPVLAGERYALVWLAKGSDGVTIAADGTVADPSKGQIVHVRRSLGKGELFTFQIDAKVKDALPAGGSWAVYLLDTRVYGADGSVTLADCSDGAVASINAAAKVNETVAAVIKNESQLVAKSAKSSSVASSSSSVPADAPQPTITDFRVVNGEVHVKVRDTVPYLQYNLASGSEPSAVSGRVAKSPQNGVAGREIELVVPATASGASFFRVRRN